MENDETKLVHSTGDNKEKETDITIKLGISELKNISKLDYASFINQLGELAKDPKLKAAIDSGLADDNTVDDKFEFSGPTPIAVRGCKPTQNEVVMSKSLKFPLAISSKEQLDEMLKSKDKNSPYTMKGESGPLYIVVFNSGGVNYVIDGHHRWSQVYACNPDAHLVSLVMTSKNENDAKDVLKAVQLSILKVVQDTASPENVVLPKAEGTGGNVNENLFTCPEDVLKEYVIDNVKETFLTSAKEAGHIKEADKSLAAEYICNNVKDLRENSQPVKDAPNRELMPQTDGADNLKDQKATQALKDGQWKKELETGVINHSDPFESKKWIKTFEQFRNKK